MTIGERNKNFVRLQENGLTIKQACEVLKMKETTGEKISSMYRKGEEVFNSEREWSPEIEVKDDDGRTSVESKKEQELLDGYMSTMDLLKMTIRVGDKVKICRDSIYKATVCAVYPYVVFCRDLKNPPCDKCVKDCKVKEICKNTYNDESLRRLCQEYHDWFVNTDKFCPPYVDVAEDWK